MRDWNWPNFHRIDLSPAGLRICGIFFRMKKILQMTDLPKFGGQNRARGRIGQGVIAKAHRAWENEYVRRKEKQNKQMFVVTDPIMSLTVM